MLVSCNDIDMSPSVLGQILTDNFFWKIQLDRVGFAVLASTIDIQAMVILCEEVYARDAMSNGAGP